MYATYLKRVRILLVLFIIGLILSGVTAFPLESELKFLSEHIGWMPQAIQDWIKSIYQALADTNSKYPYLAYGTDWLAFAHIVIAIAFWGPLKDPILNKWVIDFGIIACIAIFPLAFIAGPFRGIPVYWQLIDCSFGVGGLVLLIPIRRYISKLEQLDKPQDRN